VRKVLFCLFLVFYSFVSALETIEMDVIQVAVTGIPNKNEENAPSWTLDFFKAIEKEYNVKISYKVVPFDQSWTLTSLDHVDVVATGVTALDERLIKGSAFSLPYLQVKRALRIHSNNQDIFHTISDFIGYRVGAVEGMTALKDLYSRAPDGVEIVVFKTWDEMYQSFYASEIEAVAEGYYVSVDKEINHKDIDFPMIDDHDLIEGSPEYLVFVVRNASSGVLEMINQLLQEKGFPLHTDYQNTEANLIPD
jgi:ABC-type amino acid transport substrate-binding protein